MIDDKRESRESVQSTRLDNDGKEKCCNAKIRTAPRKILYSRYSFKPIFLNYRMSVLCSFFFFYK